MIRINKALAEAGICSRRAADAMIEQKRVHLNGRLVETPGVKIDPENDVLKVDGKVVSFTRREQKVYVLLNKPVGVVTTASDPEGRRTVLDIVPQAERARLFPVGRLDIQSRGLLLLTNDGELAYRLTHPKWHLPKVYRVRVRGDVTKQALETMRGGMTLAEGDVLAPVKVREIRRLRDGAVLEMELIQGLNRQIRRMCRDLDLDVLTLTRIQMGPIVLGDLPPKGTRHLTPAEVSDLRRAVRLDEVKGPAV
ncbi:pseudouridine synthase [Desulfovibrio inopinatus]|uniref:pseudouridine synthase n=1 Tax=Desulfovibrio inopinatus TaxID=102109 RepID=UPI0004202D36|nr:pseudouridine synthase [Desulfovibrio inopinatus]